MAIYVKAFSLVLKTVSKPLAKQVKEMAKSHPFLRELSISMALKADSLYQTIMSPTPLNEPIIGSGAKDKCQKPPVTEDQALQAAGDFLAEATVFGIAGGLVWWGRARARRRTRRRRRRPRSSSRRWCAAAADAAGRDRGAEGVRAAQTGNQRGAGRDAETRAGEGLEAVVGVGRRSQLGVSIFRQTFPFVWLHKLV